MDFKRLHQIADQARAESRRREQEKQQQEADQQAAAANARWKAKWKEAEDALAGLPNAMEAAARGGRTEIGVFGVREEYFSFKEPFWSWKKRFQPTSIPDFMRFLEKECKRRGLKVSYSVDVEVNRHGRPNPGTAFLRLLVRW